MWKLSQLEFYFSSVMTIVLLPPSPHASGDCNARQRGGVSNIAAKMKFKFRINHTVICCCCCWLRLGGKVGAVVQQPLTRNCWTSPAPAWAAGGEPLTSASADPSTPGYPRLYPAPAPPAPAAACSQASYGSAPRTQSSLLQSTQPAASGSCSSLRSVNLAFFNHLLFSLYSSLQH